MTSYDSAEVVDVDPAYGLQLDHPRFLEYVGAPESARSLTRAPGHWVQTMDRDVGVAAALQLQRDTGLMTSNLQVLGQFVTSLNRMSSEVMRLALGCFHRMLWTPFRWYPGHIVPPSTWPGWA